MVVVRKEIKETISSLVRYYPNSNDADNYVDKIIRIVNNGIDELAQTERKGFCTKTMAKIKNKINDTGEKVLPEPKN